MPCGPSVCYDIDGTGVFILGGCHHSHTPFDIQCTPVLNTLFFFAPCPILLLWFVLWDIYIYIYIKYLFSSLNMVLWHNHVSCRKEPDLFSKHCAQTLQIKRKKKKKKKAIVVTYVFQTSGLKAKKEKKKIYSVSSHVFWSEAWHSKTEIWRVSPAWQHVSPSGPRKARERVLRLLSLCCMLSTHRLPTVSCLLQPPSPSPSPSPSSSSPEFER